MRPPVCFLLDELRSDFTVEAWIKEVFFELVSRDTLLLSESRLQFSYSFIYFLECSSLFRLLHETLKKILSDLLYVYTLTAVSC